MTNVEKQRDEKRRKEMAEIGEADSNRLHEGMNKSGSSEDIRKHKQPNLATGKRDGEPAPPREAPGGDSTSGAKRHASAGTGPSEPSPATLEREGKRATTVHDKK